MKEGDKNKKYFSPKATQHKKNSICHTKDSDGVWRLGVACDQVILNYYSTLFTTSGRRGDEVLLCDVERRVTKDQNTYLETIYTTKEMLIEIKQMHPTYGMAPIFSKDTSQLLVNILFRLLLIPLIQVCFQTF